MSMVLDGVAPRSRRTDPITSVDAGRKVNLRPSQNDVFEALKHGPAAQYELERKLTKYTPQRVRSAVSELRDKGLVVDTGTTTMTPYGRTAKVWSIQND